MLDIFIFSSYDSKTKAYQNLSKIKEYLVVSQEMAGFATEVKFLR